MVFSKALSLSKTSFFKPSTLVEPAASNSEPPTLSNTLGSTTGGSITAVFTTGFATFLAGLNSCSASLFVCRAINAALGMLITDEGIILLIFPW